MFPGALSDLTCCSVKAIPSQSSDKPGAVGPPVRPRLVRPDGLARIEADRTVRAELLTKLVTVWSSYAKVAYTSFEGIKGDESGTRKVRLPFAS